MTDHAELQRQAKALIRAAISDAYYESRNDGETMEHAANVAAAAVWTVLEGFDGSLLDANPPGQAVGLTVTLTRTNSNVSPP